jgi:hypothetical protein
MSRKAMAGVAFATLIAVTLPNAPASAEGFLQFLFGGLNRRQAPPPPPVAINAPDELFRGLFERGPRRGDETVRSERSASGPHSGFCVRLCDGHYFSVQASRNVSAAQQCNAFCPAAETKVFAGSAIEHSVASDGKRYSDLPTAFAYRKGLVPSCSCNGKGAAGLASIPVSDDPTLRPGDIVATNHGFTVYNGRDPQQMTAFTPLDSAKVSKGLRDQLADTRITPRQVPAETISEPNTTSSIAQQRFSARAQ